MKRFSIVFSLLVMLLSPLIAVSELQEEVRVAVFPLWYSEDDSVAPILSSAVQSTIQWALRFIPGYELIETDDYPSMQRDMDNYIQKNNLTNVIYGRIDEYNGVYDISLFLYDGEKSQILVVKQDSVENLIEIFDRSEVLAINMLESFIGRELAFGSLRFIPTGYSSEVNYTIYINNRFLGNDLSVINNFLIGVYELRIDQNKNGDDVTIFTELINVKRGEITNIDFEILNYGYLSEDLAGPDREIELYVNDILQDRELYDKKPIAVGNYHYKAVQTDWEGNEIVILDESISINDGESVSIDIPTVDLGGGIILFPQGIGDWTVFLDNVEIGTNITQIKVDTAGRHKLVIIQSDGENTKAIYNKNINVEADSALEIYFETALLNEDGTFINVVNNDIDISADVQFFNGSIISAGLNMEFFERKLGVSTLVGFYLVNSITDNTYAYLSGTIKISWIPWGNKIMFSPYFGAIYNFSGTYIEKGIFEQNIGLLIGITWNTDWPVVSGIYFDNSLNYRFNDKFRLGYRFSLGARFSFWGK